MSPSLSKSPETRLFHHPCECSIVNGEEKAFPFSFLKKVTGINSPTIIKSCQPSLSKSVQSADVILPNSGWFIPACFVTSVKKHFPFLESLRNKKLFGA